MNLKTQTCSNRCLNNMDCSAGWFMLTNMISISKWLYLIEIPKKFIFPVSTSSWHSISEYWENMLWKSALYSIVIENIESTYCTHGQQKSSHNTHNAQLRYEKMIIKSPRLQSFIYSYSRSPLFFVFTGHIYLMMLQFQTTVQQWHVYKIWIYST